MDEIVSITGKSKPVVNKWRQRFRVNRISGLKDAPRSGKPKTITAAQQAMVIEKACSKPTGSYTNWSQERMDLYIKLCLSLIYRSDSKKRITMHYTPTYSSWLNQIEIWFNILSKDVLKGAVWHSKEQLVNQLMEYVETYNKTRAKPFNWTYTGNILKIS